MAFDDVTAFEFDSALIFVDNRAHYGEERLVAIGFIGERLHVLVHVMRDDRVRVISLRKANAREGRYYVTQIS